MSQIAIVSLLWNENLPLLERYLLRNRRTLITVQALVTPAFAEMASRLGVPVVVLDDLIPPEQSKQLNERAQELRQDFLTYTEGAEWQAYCDAEGVDGKVLLEQTDEQLSRVLVSDIVMVELLETARRHYAIELLLVNEDVLEVSRPAIDWARMAGVPSLHIEHALPALNPYTIHDVLHADVLAVSGPRAAEAYLDVGFPAERLRETGFPIADRYVDLRERRAAIRAQTAATHGLDPERPIVVFATTWALGLSASFSPLVYEETLSTVFSAARALAASVPGCQLVIKDRAPNATFGRKRSAEIAAQYGLAPEQYCYAIDDIKPWVMAADVIISLDSAVSVDAMLARTPAVNLLNDVGLRFGPCFEAGCGVQEATPDTLAATLARLLTDDTHRADVIERLTRAAPYYNLGDDGRATERVVSLMEELALRWPQATRTMPQGYVWQDYLDVEHIDATAYHESARGNLVDMFSNNPGFVLDIGCAAGGTASLVKRKYPNAKVWGIDTNRAAAEVAATKLDKVLIGKFEEFDLEAEGMARGTLDGVILADVLEHMYNPWAVMTALQPYLSTKAQVIISIPNVRNLKLMEDMAAGYWQYEPAGLLDITHIRFFTLKEFRRFLHETGYHTKRLEYGIDQRLFSFFEANKDKPNLSVKLGRMTLDGVGVEELSELCSLQFYIVASPGALAEDIGAYRASDPYHEFLRRQQLTRPEAEQYDQLIDGWAQPPKVALAIFLPEGSEQRLMDTVGSLTQQLYQHLQLWVVANGAPPAGLPRSERFHWVTTPGNLLDGFNRVLRETDADWVGSLFAGDVLEPQALLRLVEAAVRNPAWQYLYCDEDTLADAQHCDKPIFKPDFNPDYLRSMPYLGGLSLARTSLWRELGLADPALAGAEGYDLALRAFERHGAAVFGHVAGPLYHRHPDGGYGKLTLTEIVAAGKRSLEAHVQRQQLPAVVENGWLPGSYRLRMRATPPKVSLLVPVRDHLPQLQRLVEALFQHNEQYDFELLLIDNSSTDAATVAYLHGLGQIGDPGLRVYNLAQPASLARLYNILAREARGELLGLLYFDAAPLTGDWLAELAGELARPGVGLVAARTLDRQGWLHGGGLLLGLGGGYAAPFAGLPHDEPGPYGRAHLAQNFSAVVGGAWLMRRELFEAVGGFDENHTETGAAEVDFCLRLGEHGQRVLWTPYTTLLCDGEAAKLDWCRAGLKPGDAGTDHRLYERWLPKLAADPAYNRCLTSTGTPFALETRPNLQRPVLPWKPLPRILTYPADQGGCGYYRIMEPATALSQHGQAEMVCGFDLFDSIELARFDFDSIVFQRQINPGQVARMRDIRRYNQPFMVYELDDLLTNMPVKSLHKAEMPADVLRWLREGVGLCDRFIVSTQPLADALRGLHGDIRVVPNRLTSRRWLDLEVPRHQGGRPRVGWAGGISHSGDLELISDLVRALANEVDWVFLGMCPDALRPYVREFHPGVPFDRYPQALASLGLDLALAPLEINEFNEAKSNLKLLECGVLGYPVICTDIAPYQGKLPVTRVKNRYKDWLSAVREHLSDREALRQRGLKLQQAVHADWMLEQHLDQWMHAWTR